MANAYSRHHVSDVQLTLRGGKQSEISCITRDSSFTVSTVYQLKSSLCTRILLFVRVG